MRGAMTERENGATTANYQVRALERALHILDAFSLADPALSYGYNVRNLTALQTLQAVRQAASIQ